MGRPGYIGRLGQQSAGRRTTGTRGRAPVGDVHPLLSPQRYISHVDICCLVYHGQYAAEGHLPYHSDRTGGTAKQSVGRAPAPGMLPANSRNGFVQFRRGRTGDLMSRFTGDINAISYEDKSVVRRLVPRAIENAFLPDWSGLHQLATVVVLYVGHAAAIYSDVSPRAVRSSGQIVASWKKRRCSITGWLRPLPRSKS